MKLYFKLFYGCALPFLAACSSGSGSSGFQGYAAQTTADGTLEELVTSSGVSGYLGRSVDGTVGEVRVRVDDTGIDPIYYIAVDGGEEVAYDVDFVTGSVVVLDKEDGARGSYWPRTGGYLVTVSTFDESGGNQVSGFVGLQTADMPDSDLTFDGGFSFFSDGAADTVSISGEILLNYLMSDGSVTGSSEGEVRFVVLDPLTISNPGPFDIDVDGSLDGTEFNGVASITGTAVGDIDLVGAVYGETADALFAAGGGQLTYDGDVYPVGGYVETFRKDVP